MLIEQVKKLSVEDRFLYWVKERESIRLKKEAGKSKPWTDDEILKTYRFCNIRRMDDRVSRWLETNWYKPYFNHPNMIVATVLARHFNKAESLGPITEAVFGKVYKPALALSIIQRLKKEGVKVFNGAYMIHADQSADKSEMVINRVVQPFYDNPPKIDLSSIQRSVEALEGYWNIGSFMAGQIIADLRWAVKGTWEDKQTWAAIGPGSRRGMNRIKQRDIKYNLDQEQFNDELTELTEDMKELPLSIRGRLEAIDRQNCLCEFDKYERCLGGEGRPKQKYEGSK